MYGYINHDLEIKKMTDIAAKNKLDINKDVLDSPSRLDFVGAPGLTMRMLADDPVIDVYTRIVNYAKPSWKKFFDLFSACYRDTVGNDPSTTLLNNSPIIALHPKQNDKVFVYTTLVMDEYETDPFYWGRPRLVKQGSAFIKDYFADKADAKRGAAWSPLHRAKKRLMRRELVDIPRALTRFLPELTKNLTSAQIRDIATAMVEYNAPVTLSYADTDPSDFYDMYKDGPDSCMKDNGGRPFSWMAKLAKPIHPTSLFAYSPYVKGVFLKKGNKVFGRTFLYDGAHFGTNKASKGVWAFGRVYASTDKYRGIFTTALQNAGHVSLDSVSFDMAKSYTIQVPPIVVSDDDAANAGISAGEYMYIPYLDNHCREAHVAYDHDEAIAKVTFNAPSSVGKNNCSFGSQHGFLPLSAFKESYCASCGGKINAANGDGQPIYAADGSVFHGEHCARSAGYTQVIVGSGPAHAWMPRAGDNIVFDPISGRYYSPSGRAAYNVFPLITSLKEDLEDISIYSTTGVIVKVGSDYYRLPDKVVAQLSGGQIKEFRDPKYGGIYKLDDSLFTRAYLDVKTVRTVILEEDHVHIDTSTIRQIERAAA